MADETEKTYASNFLDKHPALRETMARSRKMDELEKKVALPKDDESEEQLYIVRGHTVGDKDELYVDALARGSNPETKDALARELFLEMDPALQALVIDELKK